MNEAQAFAHPLDHVFDALLIPVILVDQRADVIRANGAALASFPGLKPGFPLSGGIRSPILLANVEAVLNGAAHAHCLLEERVPVARSYETLVQRMEVDAGAEQEFTPRAMIQMQETTEQKRIEAMRADFVANASHELRTPLASILGFVETLRGAAKDDAQARAHFLAIMEAQAKRMSRLIDDLLSLSKIEQHAHILPSDRVDLRQLLSQLADALSGLAKERNVTIRSDFPEHLEWHIVGDRDELLRLFENLIENAIKYGATGQFVDLSLARDEAGGQIIALIRDYGPGIARKHLPRLTERFYRADIQSSRIQGGTGLGLAIVKHIVARHRGRLSIHSDLGQGATFSVTFPDIHHSFQ